MKENYTRAYAAERKYEGGNVDDPRDPGGRTSRGIIQREYDAYRKRKGLSKRDVWTADEIEIAEIYKEQYWDVVKGDDLPSGVDLVVFDGGVNSGPVQSVKWLQRALGVNADGHIGVVTLSAANNYPDKKELIDKILDQRLNFLRHLRTFSAFGRGWTNRVQDLRRRGKIMASHAITPDDVSVPPTPQKARPTDAATANPGTGVATTTVAGGAGSIVGQLQDAAQPLSPYADTVQIVKYILIGVALVGFVYTVYAIWKNNKIAKVL